MVLSSCSRRHRGHLAHRDVDEEKENSDNDVDVDETSCSTIAESEDDRPVSSVSSPNTRAS